MLKKIDYKDVWAFTWHYWKQRPKSGITIIALMLGATFIDTFIPVYTGKIIDTLVAAKPGDSAALHQVLVYLGIFIALNISFHLLRTASIALWAKFAVHNLYSILKDAMRKVQRFSSDWHANTFAGGTVRKITRGMWSFDVYGDTLFMGIFPAIIIMFAMTIMLSIKLPMVGLFTGLMIVIYGTTSIWLSLTLLAPRFRASAESDTKVGATLADIITGNPTVKSFGAEKREENKFNRVAKLWRLRSQKAWLAAEATNLIRSAIRVVMLSGMIAITIWLWNKGKASPGDVALSLTSFFIIGAYLRDIGMHIANLQRSISEMEDVIEFWKRDDGLRDAPNATDLKVKSGTITFKDVTFAYNGAQKPLFEKLSIHINPGEKIALVGHSGSGKSSFVKLIQRLYDVQEGEVLIDEQNASLVTQESLHQNISLVPQDPILFHRSIAANIAYGKPGATRAEIEDAARQAYAHDFIKDLPQGYETLVGERGIKLSGGERQRVAIARALLREAKILILDEATSSLDSLSEHYIQKALKHLMTGRTTITIAHRLSTIKDADRILVFNNGRIIEQGTHDELVKNTNSAYHKLYEIQALGM